GPLVRTSRDRAGEVLPLTRGPDRGAASPGGSAARKEVAEEKLRPGAMGWGASIDIRSEPRLRLWAEGTRAAAKLIRGGSNETNACVPGWSRVDRLSCHHGIRH